MPRCENNARGANSAVSSQEAVKMPGPRIGYAALHGFRVSLLLCFFVLASSALRAESPRRLNNDGVAAFQRKEFNQALGSFQKAREQAPENLLLTYNLGAAESAVEKQKEALEEFQKVSSARDAALANRARFAQGVLQYDQAAKKAQEKDLQGALTEAKAAVAANQAVLVANPTDGDARVNYELASLLQQQIETQLREQQEQQQQNKDQDQKNKEDQKDKQQKQEQQKQESAAATPTPAPNPTPQQGQKDQQERQDQQKQGNPAPTPTPVATPTPQQGTQQQQKPEESKEKKPEEAQAAQQQKYKKSEDAKEQETLAGLLNILQDNDPEALKRMLKRRFGNVIQPEKDW